MAGDEQALACLPYLRTSLLVMRQGKHAKACSSPAIQARLVVEGSLVSERAASLSGLGTPKTGRICDPRQERALGDVRQQAQHTNGGHFVPFATLSLLGRRLRGGHEAILP